LSGAGAGCEQTKINQLEAGLKSCLGGQEETGETLKTEKEKKKKDENEEPREKGFR